MKRTLYLLVAWGFFSLSVSSQSVFPANLEIEVGTGLSVVFADIGSMAHGPVFNLAGWYVYSPVLRFGPVIESGLVAGNDEGTRNQTRDYSFTTFFLEPSFEAEYVFLQSKRRGVTRRGIQIREPRHRAWVSGGLGVMYFHPTPGDSFVDRFEDNFSHFSASLHTGTGYNFILDNKWTVGMKLGVRYLTTDYFEGYSSSFSEALDLGYLGAFTVRYRFTGKGGR